MDELKEKSCESCRYFHQTCPILPCSDCSEQFSVPDSKWEAYTKADWIRSLSDGELAAYIASLLTGHKDGKDWSYDKVLSYMKEPLEKMQFLDS